MRATDYDGLLAPKSAHDSSFPGAISAAICRFETAGSGGLCRAKNGGSLATGHLAAPPVSLLEVRPVPSIAQVQTKK
jgi:hypothetical protein